MCKLKLRNNSITNTEDVTENYGINKDYTIQSEPKVNTQSTDTVAELQLQQRLIDNRISGATSKHLLSPAETEQGYRVNRLYGTEVSKNQAALKAPVDTTIVYTNDEYISAI